ncbi:MAG: TlpA disulfide reductase family protein [Bacteroidota bacterium]
MKKIIALVLIAGLFTSCTNSNSQTQEEGVTLSGTVLNSPVGIITIEGLTRESSFPIDTIEVNDDNTFSHVFTGEAGFYRVNFFNTQNGIMIIDQDDLVINFDGSNAAGNIVPEGSSEIETIQEFSTTVNTEFAAREQELTDAYNAANQEGDVKKADKVRDDYMELVAEKQEFSAALIRKYDVTMATYQLVSFLDTNSHLELKDSLAQLLNAKYPGRFYIEDLVSNLEKAKVTAVGSLAPEISLPNPDGEIVTLSSLRGQVVLIDFWAQWCKPCRRENPNVVAAYNNYKDKGFTVFGVSLDRTKENWLKAIEEDGLTWTHVSDLKYFNSVAAQEYGVQSIPFSILLDREGKIIAKNLRGPALEKALEDHFSQEAGKM